MIFNISMRVSIFVRFSIWAFSFFTYFNLRSADYGARL